MTNEIDDIALPILRQVFIITVFSGNCRENLGSCELVTKCNHLVDFNKVAISCEKLFW